MEAMAKTVRAAEASGRIGRVFITYDSETGSAYISLLPSESGFVPRSPVTLEECEGLGEAADEIVLDLDEEGRLVGIEVLSPEVLLRSETLARLRDG